MSHYNRNSSQPQILIDSEWFYINPMADLESLYETTQDAEGNTYTFINMAKAPRLFSKAPQPKLHKASQLKIWISDRQYFINPMADLESLYETTQDAEGNTYTFINMAKAPRLFSPVPEESQ
jgi:hypothetical protein